MINEERKRTIHSLNELLRGELSAVETYSQALSVLRDAPDARRNLIECQSSHRTRVDRLRQEIVERGGHPESTSGSWGSFAKIVEGGAKTVGSKLALSALEAGEDHGLREYQDLLPTLDSAARDVVSTDLYPQQMRTHGIMSSLKRELADAS